jgi:PIN domain nuclease of toxin-antitoxin system
MRLLLDPSTAVAVSAASDWEIAAQSRIEGLPVASADAALSELGAERMWE